MPEEMYKCEACGHVGTPKGFEAEKNKFNIHHWCPKCKSEDVFSSLEPVLEDDMAPRVRNEDDWDLD
jgi:hypothetical protein